MTLGEDGSGFSKEQPRFLPFVAGNMGEAWPPLILPLLLNLLLRDVDREICEESLARPGLKIDFEEIFMEDEEDKRDVKQMKSSLVLVVVLVLLLVLRCGGLSVSISCSVCFVSYNFLVFLFYCVVLAINKARVSEIFIWVKKAKQRDNERERLLYCMVGCIVWWGVLYYADDSAAGGLMERERERRGEEGEKTGLCFLLFDGKMTICCLSLAAISYMHVTHINTTL